MYDLAMTCSELSEKNAKNPAYLYITFTYVNILI